MSRAVVIGGGIAGIAAALRLAEAGHAPVLVETRRKLGGRATSFVDPRTGQVLDNCQHVAMGFWEPVVVSACNLPSDRVDAPFAMQVFQEGFLSHRFASAMGLSVVPLLQLYDPAEALLAKEMEQQLLGVSQDLTQLRVVLRVSAH